MMISSETRAKYRATIGIECHVQLKTKTKLFSAVGNDAREAPPNTLVSHIDFGLPGALPVLNREALHLAARAAFALGTEPARFSKFDRKHYFYPDLPKGYQISQFDEPIIGKGAMVIEVNGQEKTIGITRAHLEEDAGKSVHPDGKDYSLVDLNRAGTPLLEIVSEPDLHSGTEAKAYARELYLRMRYADVSEADLYYGNMRFDVNVSVSQTDELGTRSETKNLNSFRAVEKAVDYEIARQIELLEKGEKIIQETRGWDDSKQKTFSQRTKENADDYRYMPDPDLPPIVLDEEYVAKIKAEMPKLPPEIRQELSKYDLGDQVIEDILDNPDIYAKLSAVTTQDTAPENVRRIAYDSLEKPATLKISAENHIKVAENVRTTILNSSSATEILEALLTNENQNVDELIQNKAQVSDEGEIAKIVEQVLSENAKAAEDVKNGEMKAIGFLVGQVMKLSQGKANPQLAQELIKKQLGS
jgi:aspartyl-tRNA(Asn)/glutamyl-tRNA(Gln) amidotransferase subunit B